MLISLSSIKNYFTINSFIIFTGFIQTVFNESFLELSYSLLPITSIFILRNVILLNVIEYGTKNKQVLHSKNNNKLINKNLKIFYLISSTFVEVLTHLFIIKYFNFYNERVISLIYFIPISFLYEIIFDFFHYWTHIMLHYNKFLYINLHKIHHTYNHPTAIIAFSNIPLI